MKNNFLLLTLLLVGSVGSIAQNKTLGVGTAAPNPNAVLHLEAPTNNQGFLMPRMTTAQRTAVPFVSALSPTDNGLMVYDTDLQSVYVWEGSQWSAVNRLDLPYEETILSAPNGSNLLRLVYSGSAVENVGIAQFENTNPNNGFTPLFARTNSATNGAVDLVVNNVSNNNDAIGVVTNGLGTAGRFTINNASNASSAIYASTNGTGVTAAAITAETATAFSAITARGTGGSANALTGIITDTGAGGYAVLGSVSAVGGGQAGVFNISNTANPNNTLEATTSGTGGAGKFKVANIGSLWPAVWAETNSNQPLSAAIYGLNTGTGDAAGVFRINNAANNFSAVFAETNGKTAGLFKKNAGTGPTVYIDSQTGGGLFANHNGPTGYAGIIQTINTSNTTPALYAESAGTGASIWALKSTDAVSGDALLAENEIPTGSAGKFAITNAANSNPTIVTTTNSTTNGAAILATNTGVGDAVFATANSGSGGNFQNTNVSNNASVVFASTNAQTGHAVGAMNTANGSAFSIFQGGMKLSTFEVTTGTTIATRAAAYRITGGGPFTLSFPSATGDMYMVYNDTVSPITFEGVSIPANSGKIVINFNSGSFRGL